MNAIEKALTFVQDKSLMVDSQLRDTVYYLENTDNRWIRNICGPFGVATTWLPPVVGITFGCVCMIHFGRLFFDSSSPKKESIYSNPLNLIKMAWKEEEKKDLFFFTLDGKIVPKEMWIEILKHLSVDDLLSCSLVCKYLHQISRDDRLWKPLLQRDFPNKNVTEQITSYEEYASCFVQWREDVYGPKIRRVLFNDVRNVLLGGIYFSIVKQISMIRYFVPSFTVHCLAMRLVGVGDIPIIPLRLQDLSIISQQFIGFTMLEWFFAFYGGIALDAFGYKASKAWEMFSGGIVLSSACTLMGLVAHLTKGSKRSQLVRDLKKRT
eukprot:TRINITY_DN5641_c0_g1_i1.p1 TRINITY_DN5641_c0_g1~~TRINITY_DN5641_c0_g1_i1.p1  ORF type:complete len:323 (-),score=70.60 TRINITY_DN5641_c0_g1_i1:315-1283(-)